MSQERERVSNESEEGGSELRERVIHEHEPTSIVNYIYYRFQLTQICNFKGSLISSNCNVSIFSYTRNNQCISLSPPPPPCP